MTMFFEWVAAGAAFGIKAFSALCVFGMICAACFGVFSALTYVAKGGEPDAGKKRRPY